MMDFAEIITDHWDPTDSVECLVRVISARRFGDCKIEKDLVLQFSAFDGLLHFLQAWEVGGCCALTMVEVPIYT